MFEGLAETAGPGSALAQKATGLNATVMLSAGESDARVTLRDGAVLSVERGPFVMPSFDFRIAAPEEEWARFFMAVPPPGSHDIIALLRRGVLTLDGNLHPLMANLLYFKLLLASLRPKRAAP